MKRREFISLCGLSIATGFLRRPGELLWTPSELEPIRINYETKVLGRQRYGVEIQCNGHSFTDVYEAVVKEFARTSGPWPSRDQFVKRVDTALSPWA